MCHRCDNPVCINPAHLFLGTWKDNRQDAMRKGRLPRLAGSMNGHSKLTETQVADIKQRLRAGERQVDIARLYTVDKGLVSQIHRGLVWTHVS